MKVVDTTSDGKKIMLNNEWGVYRVRWSRTVIFYKRIVMLAVWPFDWYWTIVCWKIQKIRWMDDDEVLHATPLNQALRKGAETNRARAREEKRMIRFECAHNTTLGVCDTTQWT